MSDVNNYEWELSKENVQPLKSGRNVNSLLTAFNHEEHVKQQRNEQRKILERTIMAYDGADPLDPWRRYIQWVEENYPQGGKESDLLTVLEQCLEKMKDCQQYRNDPRLLEVYLRYLDLTETNAEWFNQLYGAGYFHQLASFYVHWAESAEAAGNYKEGTRIYSLGVQNKAEPADKLQESYQNYQTRVASAVFNTVRLGGDEQEGQQQKRSAFGELEPVSGGRTAPVVRSGAPVLRFQNNRTLLPAHGKVLANSNRHIRIREDENGSPPVAESGPVVNTKISLPIHTTMKGENVTKAGKWTDVGPQAVVKEAVPSLSSVQPLFQVHVDDTVSGRNNSKADGAGFTTALKERATTDRPTKLTMQTLFERDNKGVRLMCDLDRLLVGNREFSFEEVRRQCYEKAGRHPSATAKSAEPVDNAAPLPTILPQVDASKEKTDGIGAKSVTAGDAVQQPGLPPLKPNEKWACNIDELYRDGREVSFEELRARSRLYKIRTQQVSAVKDSIPLDAEKQVVIQEQVPPEAQGRLVGIQEKVETRKVIIDSQESVPNSCQPDRTPVTTCEMAVQTDLCGLDYDVILVPRQPPPPVQDERSSPPPPGPTSGEPSPTVNTKRAMSSVKNWFNSSVLVPAALHPVASADTVAAKPAKKNVFAIFKDPSMVVADEENQKIQTSSKTPAAGFSVFKDPSVLAFDEEERHRPPVANSGKLQTRPFGVRSETTDERAPDQENEPVARRSKLTLRKPLAALAPAADDCEKATESPVGQEKDLADNFKENVPPSEFVPEKVAKRQLSGILLPSVDIPFDPTGGQTEPEQDVPVASHEPVDDALARAYKARLEAMSSPPPQNQVSRALFVEPADDDQTRHYCIPLTEDVDFTVPSAGAFAKDLRIQSTPLHPPLGARQNRQLDDDVTFHLQGGRALSVLPSSHNQQQDDRVEKITPASTQPAVTDLVRQELASKMRRGLSPIDEISREYFSSSSSSAGTTGLGQYSSRLSVGVGRSDVVGRIYPAHFDPFDAEYRNGLLACLAVPLHERNGFNPVSGRVPVLRSHSSIQLGNGDLFVVKQAIGQGAYAKIYEAFVATGTSVLQEKKVLKVQETDGLWEFYVTSELKRRLTGTSNNVLEAVTCVDRGYFYDSGSVLLMQHHAHGTMLDMVNHYKLRSCSIPEPLVFHLAIQLLTVVANIHESGILHADIKPDNIMMQVPKEASADFALPLTEPGCWTADSLLAAEDRVGTCCFKLIDFGRSIDLALFPERTSFMHCFAEDKCPEMRDGKPWAYQLDYYGLATTIFTLLMGVHCKVVHADGLWRVPNLKRGHSGVWRDLTTALLNASSVPLDLLHWRRVLAEQLVTTVRAREFADKVRELERYLLQTASNK